MGNVFVTPPNTFCFVRRITVVLTGTWVLHECGLDGQERVPPINLAADVVEVVSTGVVAALVVVVD